MLLLYVPPVQRFAAGTFSDLASKKLDTKVTIDRLSLTPFNNVTLEGFYLEDHGQDTLLYADRVSASFSILKLLGGGVSLRTVEVDSPKFYMHQDEDGTTNFRKILDKLRNPNPNDKKTQLQFGRIRVTDMSYRLRKLNIRPREYGVNFDDLAVDGFNCDASDVMILGDSVSIKINSLSLREKCGLVINSMSADNARVCGQAMCFTNMHIVTPESDALFERLTMDYEAWQSHSDFINSVYVEGKVRNSTVAFPTIAFFAPSLREWRSVVSNVNAQVKGTVADMAGHIASASIGESDMAFRFAIKGLPDVKKTNFDINIERFSARAEDLETAIADVTRKQPSPALIDKLNNMGTLDVRGKFAGTLSRFTTNATVSSDLGGADLDLRFTPAPENKTAFAGNVKVNDVRLGRIIKAEKIGGLTLEAKLDGHFGNGKMDGEGNVDVKSFEFNDYAYNDIAMNGYFNNSYFKGVIGSNDPNIKFDFDGMLDFNDSIPLFDFNMQLFNADLNKLNLVERDSVALLRGNVVAKGSASSLDNFNGKVTIDELLYINAEDSINPGKVVLSGENSPHSKLLRLQSDFADAQFRSRLSYGDMMKGLRAMLTSYIPTLYPRDKEQHHKPQQSASINDYSLLSVSVKETNNIADIFIPGLMVAKGSKLSFMFNPSTNKFTLAASSDYIEYKNNFVSKLNLDTHNNNQDSLTLFINADDLYASGFYMPEFSVLGGAKDNRLTTTVRFNDTEKERSALIGVDVTLGRSEANGLPQLMVRTTPSSFTNKGKRWTIYTRGIAIDSTQIEVRNFGIVNDKQQLQVNGIASRNLQDTLHINLSSFDMNVLTQFTENMGYHVGGRTSGHVDIMSALKDGYMHIGLNTDSMTVNEVAVPDMIFETAWDFNTEKATFSLSDKKDKTQYLTGYYLSKERLYDADVQFSGFKMSLLDPMLKGVITDTKGTADAKVKVHGIRRALKINGDIEVDGLTTTVAFLNVPYSLPKTTVKMKDNALSLRNATLTDPEGNKADFSFGLNLSSLANITYSLDVKPRDMMVLNTSEKDNELFYGKVYASGAAAIRGDKAGVKMDITATTSDNSAFYMPFTDVVSSAGADVIRFIDPNRFRSDSLSYLRRKQMIMSRGKRRGDSNRSSINIGMELNVQPNMDFQLLIDPRVGDILEGRGRGLLNINVNPTNNEFTMYGECEIMEGSYQFTLQDIVSKKFQIEPGGRITWTGDPMEADLDVSAVYKLRASLSPLLGTTYSGRMTTPVECRIRLTDKLSNPTVTFDVALPEASPEVQVLARNAMSTQEGVANQFLFLVAARTFYSDDTGMSSIGSSAGNTIAFEMLSAQIGSWLSNDKFNIGFGYKRNEDIASDEYNLDFSTQLFDNRLILEIEGNFDTGGTKALNSGNKDASNLTGNFYLTWLMDRAGNLRVKGFSRTIDRFDDYGLQESGVGLYYKEDFDHFGDVIRNFRKRFRWRSNKLEREALEREEAEAANETADDSSQPTPAEEENNAAAAQAENGNLTEN